MPRARRFLPVLVPLLFAPALAFAQASGSPPSANGASFLGFAAGTATADSTQDWVLGGVGGWRFTQRFGAEGRINWYKRPEGEDTVSASLTAQLHLRAGPVSPLLRAGAGILVASYDRNQRVPPEFYRQRMTSAPFRRFWTFNDPVAVFGGGVDIPSGRYVSIRPDVESLIVWRGRRTHTIVTASVQLTIHFEPQSGRTAAKNTAR